MGRFILRFKGPGAMPAADLARIHATPGVKVVDSSSRMVQVEAPAETVHQLAEALSDWISTPERKVPLPDPRPKIRPS